MSQPDDVLLEIFGHSQFRGRQKEIIERILDNKHCLVIMPTGMGKSVCFQIPAIVLARASKQKPENNRSIESNLNQTDSSKIAEPDPNKTKPPLTLVISPLIALMKDQVDALMGKGVDATFILSLINI